MSGKDGQAMPLVWQDRELRFDVPRAALECRRGEFEIDSINSVEDTKGNNGERGFLIVTNLRMIWADHKNSATNLSIGYDCITNMSIKKASSRLRGDTQALYIMTKFSNSRFEFIFTSLVKASPRLFTTVQAVYRWVERGGDGGEGGCGRRRRRREEGNTHWTTIGETGEGTLGDRLFAIPPPCAPSNEPWHMHVVNSVLSVMYLLI